MDFSSLFGGLLGGGSSGLKEFSSAQSNVSVGQGNNPADAIPLYVAVIVIASVLVMTLIILSRK